MAAKRPTRRPATAKRMAEHYGLSVRHVQRVWAEPRETFLARAAERRERAAELRRQGYTQAQIGAELGCSAGAAGALLFEARRYGISTDPTPTGIAV